MLTEQEIEDRVTHHPPTIEAIKLHTMVRDDTRKFMTDLEMNIPDCREKSLAITHLEEVMFWANAAIARNHAKL